MSLLHWNGTLWWDWMLNEGRFSFIMDCKVCGTTIESVAGVLAAIGYLWRLVVGANEEFFLLIATFTVWICVNKFQSGIKTCRRQKSIRMKSWSEVSKEYETIKILVEMINSLFGWSMLYLVVETTLFNSVNTDDLFQNNDGFDWGKVFTSGIYSLKIAAVFLFSADVCIKVLGN